MVNNANLTAVEVSRVARCHRNTVVNYSDRGVIIAYRDSNGFRRYSLDQALKLKEILEQRTPEIASVQAC